MRSVMPSVTQSDVAVGVAVGDEVRNAVGVVVVLSVWPLVGLPGLRSVLRYCGPCCDL